MALSKREKNIFTATIVVALGAALYTLAVEPAGRYFADITGNAANDKYARLLERKADIEKRYNEIYLSKYWKDTPEKQQAGFQLYLESIARSAGAGEILNVRPDDIKEGPGYKELSIQLDLQSSPAVLANFLYKIGTAPIPLGVKKLYIGAGDNNTDEVKSQLLVSMVWPGEGKK